MNSLIFRIGIVVLLAAQLAGVDPADATLGEPAASVDTDLLRLGGYRAAKTASSGYEIEEIRSDATTVREFISPEGVVFALAWNGLVHPNLTPLLGTYATDYQQALKDTPRTPGRKSLQVSSPRVVVEKWGHMRNLQGRAYAPDLLPPGVTIHEIK